MSSASIPKQEETFAQDMECHRICLSNSILKASNNNICAQCCASSLRYRKLNIKNTKGIEHVQQNQRQLEENALRSALCIELSKITATVDRE